MSEKVCTLGIDLGGTNIVFGLVTPEGELLDHFSCPTGGEMGPAAVISNILDGIGKSLEKAGSCRVNGIGLGSPGVINTETGVVLQCAPNIPDWTGQQIHTPIAERFGLPTWVDNDAKCAVMGEAIFGAGAGRQHMMVVTLGTGIGGGVVIGGRIHRGGFHVAGEIGHAVVQKEGRRCACGLEGHLEAYASAKGIVGQAHEELDKGRTSTLSGVEDGKLTAKMVVEAAREGDTLAAGVIENAGHYLGLALANVAMVFDPQIMVISGGISLAGPVLFDHIQAAYDRYIFYTDVRKAPIVPAELGFEAGMVGAAAMAMVELDLELRVEGR
jgi:glucokinase